MLWLLFGLCLSAALFLFLIAPRGKDGAARRRKMPLCPYAHRGLHGQGAPENSLPAFRCAARKGYGIELDVRMARDGTLVVFHDESLERMCGVDRRIGEMTWEEIRACRLGGTGEAVPALSQALEAVAPFFPPLILEMKSEGAARKAVPPRLLREMEGYPGFWCVESFDPRMVRWFKKRAPEVIRGQLAFDPARAGEAGNVRLFLCARLLMNFLSRPDFIAYRFDTDGNAAFRIVRRLFRPLTAAWTVRTEKDFQMLRARYDLQIFEGFEP